MRHKKGGGRKGDKKGGGCCCSSHEQKNLPFFMCLGVLVCGLRRRGEDGGEKKKYKGSCSL